MGGVVVIPVGKGQQQALTIITRTAKGHSEQQVATVNFVPLLAGKN